MSAVELSGFPVLRFPGFAASFKTFSLGRIARVIDCKHRTPKYVIEGIPIVSPGTIKWGELDLLSPTKRVTTSDYESLMDHCSPGVGDLVLSRNQSLGVASYIGLNTEFVLGQDTVLIQYESISCRLIFYFLQTSKSQIAIARLSGGSTFSRINLKDIRLLPLTLPAEKKEQQKIADFLTAVDTRIEQLSQKKKLLEYYKKGVMQQLFSQAIRFKDDDGNEYPDWEDKKLGDVAEKIVSGKSKPEKNGIYPVYGSTEVIGRSASFTHNCESILIARVGANAGAVYRACGEYAVTDNTLILTVIGAENLDFIEYFLENYKLKRLVFGTGQPLITGGLLKAIRIVHPSFPEQAKIAKFLSAIDSKIENVSKQIEETKTFKKGLLQQMFV